MIALVIVFGIFSVILGGIAEMNRRDAKEYRRQRDAALERNLELQDKNVANGALVSEYERLHESNAHLRTALGRIRETLDSLPAAERVATWPQEKRDSMSRLIPEAHR